MQIWILLVSLTPETKNYPMSNLQEDEAKEILTPYLGKVERIYNESLENLNAFLESVGQDINKRNRSGLLHNFAVNGAKKYLGEDAEVVLSEKYSTLQIRFKGDKPIIARFKKVNKKKLSNNVSTFRSNSISMQGSLFPHFESPTYLDFGYRMNATNTEYDALMVVCRNGKDVLWSFELGNSIEEIKTITRAPVTPTTGEEKQVIIRKING